MAFSPDTVAETCCCGATTTYQSVVGTIITNHLRAFRDAHAVCREKKAAEALDTKTDPV